MNTRGDTCDALAPSCGSVHTLSDTDRMALRTAVRAVADIDMTTDPQLYVSRAQAEGAILSSALLCTLDRFRQFGHPHGAILLRGVPIGDISGSEATVDVQHHPAEASAALSILLARLGEQYGYSAESKGRLVQNVQPSRSFEADQISLGSKMELQLHVEMAFSSYRPDHIGLLCLRADRNGGGATTLSTLDRVLPAVRPRALAVLRSERFRNQVDLSFRRHNPKGPAFSQPIAVIGGPVSRPTWCFDHASTEPLDAAASMALNQLVDAALAARTEVTLVPGDLLLISNRTTAHGRTPFTPRYDRKDRWLLRAFATDDLNRCSDAFTSGRVLR